MHSVPRVSCTQADWHLGLVRGAQSVQACEQERLQGKGVGGLHQPQRNFLEGGACRSHLRP